MNMADLRPPSHGGTLLGLIIGLVLGLLVALGVAIYVSKVPVPFMNKGAQRGAEPTPADAQKNKDWDQGFHFGGLFGRFAGSAP